MKKILILAFTNLRHDARVMRQVDLFSKDYAVTVACLDAHDSPAFRIVRLTGPALTFRRKILMAFFLTLRKFYTAHEILYPFRPSLDKLAAENFDVIIANDVETLPTAFKLKKETTKIIFDAHEYAPRHFEDKLWWRVFFQRYNLYFCRKYIPRVDGMMTVGANLAIEYRKHFGVEPLVIHNAPNYYEIAPSPVERGKIRLVHLGIANASRRLELMIEMVQQLDDRFSIDMFLLVPGFASPATVRYIERLKALASSSRRVRILPPINRTEIIPTINKYDIGVFLLPPINFNYANTLPNKFFDFIQARLGIAIGPTPEMAAIVKQYANGVVSADFEPRSLAAELRNLRPEDIQRFKQNSAKAAADLNAEKNAVAMRSVVEKALSR